MKTLLLLLVFAVAGFAQFPPPLCPPHCPDPPSKPPAVLAQVDSPTLTASITSLGSTTDKEAIVVVLGKSGTHERPFCFCQDFEGTYCCEKSTGGFVCAGGFPGCGGDAAKVEHKSQRPGHQTALP